MDLKVMHKKWLTSTTARYEEHPPELTGIAEAIKEHWFRSSNWIETKSETDLPFIVQTVSNEKSNLA